MGKSRNRRNVFSTTESNNVYNAGRDVVNHFNSSTRHIRSSFEVFLTSDIPAPDQTGLFPNFVVPDAAYNGRTTRSGCLDGTRKPVISKILGWKDDMDAMPICWLSGPAGYGKSAVSQTVAESCANEGTLAASFFFLRGAGGRSEFRHFITSLAFQITISIPKVKPLVLKALQDDPTIPYQSTTEQLQKLILGPLVALPGFLTSSGRLLVVIDALDECNDRQAMQEFIVILASACSSQNLPLRWLLTSRGEEHIRRSFSNDVPKAATALVQLDEFDARVDIGAFLRARFSEIIKHNPRLFRDFPQPWPSLEEFRALVWKSSGLFIFAATLVNFITDGNGPPDEKLKSVLDMHAGLDPLYDQVIRAVSPGITCFRKVLAALMISYRQPSVELLADMLQLGTHAVLHALMAIQSIIRIPADDSAPIQLNHTSLRDFLVDSDRAKDLFINPSMAHATFTVDCVKLLRRNLRQDTFTRDKATLYAAEYWPRHLGDSSAAIKDIPELLGALQDFSSKVIEPWVNILMRDIGPSKMMDTLIAKYKVPLFLRNLGYKLTARKPSERDLAGVLKQINAKIKVHSLTASSRLLVIHFLADGML
ncbi:hypothetical protein HWV62_36336 [Athelia sp. TMB]|nr:hypothetical protein HWV62_36336 [Athelia sp. TMB]